MDTAGRKQLLETPNVILNPYRHATAGGGLTSGLLAWYDMTNGSGTKDLADKTGNHSDLTETNSPTYSGYYAECDDAATPNKLNTPAGLFVSTPSFLPTSGDDGTLLICIEPTSVVNGDYPFFGSGNYTYIRYITGGWRVKLGNVEHSSSSAPTGGIQVVGGTHSGGTTEAFVDGASVGNTSGTFGTGGFGPVMCEDNVASSDARFRIYWIGVWDRVLDTSTEINSATLKSSTTMYADL